MYIRNAAELERFELFAQLKSIQNFRASYQLRFNNCSMRLRTVTSWRTPTAQGIASALSRLRFMRNTSEYIYLTLCWLLLLAGIDFGLPSLINACVVPYYGSTERILSKAFPRRQKRAGDSLAKQSSKNKHRTVAALADMALTEETFKSNHNAIIKIKKIFIKWTQNKIYFLLNMF